MDNDDVIRPIPVPKYLKDLNNAFMKMPVTVTAMVMVSGPAGKGRVYSPEAVEKAALENGWTTVRSRDGRRVEAWAAVEVEALVRPQRIAPEVFQEKPASPGDCRCVGEHADDCPLRQGGG